MTHHPNISEVETDLPELPGAVAPEDATAPRPLRESSSRSASSKRARQAATALVVSLAALTVHAREIDLVRDIQRYCTACWKNAHLDPGLWEDCTQEVCCQLLTRMEEGQLDLAQVFEEDTPERRELVRAIDMVRKRVQRARRFQALEIDPLPDPADIKERRSLELGEILDAARREVLSSRQDQILDLWTHGWTVPEIADQLHMSNARVSDEKYKALRKLQAYLDARQEELHA